jgi:hypothetical protein
MQSSENRLRFLVRWGARIRKHAIENCLAKGGRHFWREMARSLNVDRVSGEGVVVHADHVAAAQKQYGGPIKALGRAAGGADALTIPIKGAGGEGLSANRFALSTGKRLHALCEKGGRHGVLGYDDDQHRFHAVYVLTPQTRPQRAEPFFPDRAEIERLGVAEAEAVLSSAN